MRRLLACLAIVASLLGATDPVAADDFGSFWASLGGSQRLEDGERGLAVQAQYLAELPRWIALGIEGGYSHPDHGADVIQAGVVGVLGPTLGVVRPYLTFGSAAYFWFGDPTGTASFIGVNLGPGLRFRPAKRVAFRVEARWHWRVQRLDVDKDFDFVSAMLGVGTVW
jgi:hypothetical protein